MNHNIERNFVNELMEQCISCGACSENCLILQEIDEDPAAIAARGAEVDEAFACSLCKLCEAVCPLDLSPAQMFQDKRIQSVAAGEIDIDELRYLFPDRPMNVMNLFRQYYGIDYSDLNQSSPAQTAFFPGCTMMTYSPLLTRKVFETLSANENDLLFFTDCCGKPLYQLGMEGRWDKNREHLIDKIKGLGVKKLIVACPNCFYELRQAMVNQDIEIISVYEVLKENGTASSRNVEAGTSCTIHDSCPDRFEGIMGTQVREALEGRGYRITEMEDSREKTICCGSGGQISHFRPEFAQQLVQQRLSEAEKTGAQNLVAFCHSCVLNFSRNESKLKVRHALNLLLDFEEDYTGVKNKAQEMFEGPDGEANWQKVMADPEEE